MGIASKYVFIKEKVADIRKHKGIDIHGLLVYLECIKNPHWVFLQHLIDSCRG